MNEKIKEGVYTQSFKNKKVINEYKKLEEVPFKRFKRLENYTNKLEKDIEDCKIAIGTLTKKVKELNGYLVTIVKSIGGLEEWR